ncbi:biofilm-associated protein [Candidatus Nitrosotenuis cloacae]|uniref:biofilm-associated protein n=1 Tax=Candidatus Nitrosotenuis cloacae TaxID=1603555 RepID=UPI0022809D6F|nr:biofilm-associated protein [Candidatus Nitrosotenuis cloacae]
MFIREDRSIVSPATFLIFSLVAFAAFTVFIFPDALAQTGAKSTGFEKTTLIEFTNNDTVEINTVRMWLGKDAGDFKSFKTEKGWTGTKTAQGLLVFTTSQPLGPGESVKFGIKTEVASPGINWRTMDTSGNEITTGKTAINQEAPPEQVPTPPPEQPKTANFENAKFRIIPESPKNGDEIRIIGEGFPPNITLDFFIDNEKLEDFQSDNSGGVLGKTKIPVTKESDRVDLSLADAQGNKKTISIRIQHAESVIAEKVVHLTVTQATEIVGPGDTARVSGTAKPGSTVAITARDTSGTKIYEVAVPVDSQGNWSHETVIPPDAPLGSRMVEFSNGQDVITKTLSISITKSIRLTPSAIKYNPGETILVNGTAAAGKPVEVIIKDPIGKEIFSDILQIDESGTVTFDYPTQQSSTKGTYVIIATQEQETEILRIGLGVAPIEQIVAKFDKLNYATSDEARLTIQGPAKSTILLSIIDPSDKEKFTDSITMGLDGRKDYYISLKDYKSGVYSAVLQYLGTETNVVFAVGLQRGSGEIAMQATKQTYLLGEGILVLGSSKPNVLLTLEMSDPAGKIIKHKDVFTDKEGKFKDETFRVPADAEQGIWIIRASSGPNYAEAKIVVAGTIDQSFVIKVDKSTPYSAGDYMKITGTGGGKTQTASATIMDPKDAKVTDLSTFSTNVGSFQITWIVPTGLESGTYKIKATIGNEVAEATFTIQ